MKLIAAATLLFLLCAVVDGIQIEVLDAGSCDNSDSSVKITLNFNKDEKSCSAEIESSINIEEDDEFRMDIYERNDDDEWELYKQPKARICESVRNYMLKAWEKIKDVSDPKIAEACSLPKGNYKFDTFTLNAEDINPPQGFLGPYRLEANLLKDDEDVSCFYVELLISQ